MVDCLGVKLNKWDIKYMLEGEQSKTDRLIDIIGKNNLHIDDLLAKNEEQKINIAALVETNRKLNAEKEKYKQIHKANYEKDFLTAMGENTDN